MADHVEPLFPSILPQPHRIDRQPGRCLLSRDSRLRIEFADPRVVRMVEAIRGGSRRTCETASGSELVLVRAETAGIRPQGYCLDVSPDRITLAASEEQGCFYGLHTLQQLCSTTNGEIPCCTIHDAPDFQTRGILHDVTRGKVPTLETLKQLVDRLAALKINQLQLYMEHAFVYSFDPEICGGDHGLTSGEVSELDAYATQRFVQLVPAVATLGHMGKILSMSRYQELAEIPSRVSWEEMDWPTRARGLTLDCQHPESWALVERIWSDILNAFSSPVVNICGDEPWDLGQGSNHEPLEGDARGRVYLDHIARTHALCARAGRQCYFWSDVITRYPALFERVPQDATVLHWGYDDEAEYETTLELTRAGVNTFVCPGTSAWKRLIPAMDLAERNIASFARVGKKAGAVGMITTDWGDHGHFNPLACSHHGMALGASLAWDADHPQGRAFDEAFAARSMGVVTTDVLCNLRELGRRGEAHDTWPLLWKSARALIEAAKLPPRDSAEKHLELAIAIVDSLPAANSDAKEFDLDAAELRLDSAELRLACEFDALLSRKILILSNGKGSRATHAEFVGWAADVRLAVESYADNWTQRNKPSGLADIVAGLKRMVEDVRRTVC